VDALIAVIEKAIESKEITFWQTGKTLKNDSLPLDIKSKDLDGPVTYEQRVKPFVFPIKKKRMNPPIGKREKLSKKKR